MPFTQEQINEIKFLNSKLKPIAAYSKNANIIICNQGDFIRLCKEKKVFIYEDEENRYVSFFYPEDGLIYKYIILSPDANNTVGENDTHSAIRPIPDFSPCEKEEFLSIRLNPWNLPLLDTIEKRVEKVRYKKEWLPKDFFDDFWKEIEELISETLVNVNSEINVVKQKYEQGEWWGRERDWIIKDNVYEISKASINRLDKMERAINSLGVKYKQDTLDVIKKDAELLDLKHMSRRDKELAINKLFAKANPEPIRDKYHISKTDIAVLFDEIEGCS